MAFVRFVVGYPRTWGQIIAAKRILFRPNSVDAAATAPHNSRMNSLDARAVRGWMAALALACTLPWPRPASAVSPPESPSPAIFPFCIDWHDSRKRTFTEQAAMLKELGYNGVGHIGLDKVADRLRSLDDVGLRLFQITMTVEVGPAKEPFDPRFPEVLALVKGRAVQFALLVNGMKPSDPSVDSHAVVILGRLADLTRGTDAQLLLYPHLGSWIERIEDACRVADRLNRPEVGVMFNLCHWLRVDASRDYRPLLERAKPRLWAVSVNGADVHDVKPGWDRYIQPLGQGSFDVAGFLATLRSIGYTAPVGLQCYGIGGDTRDHLAASMTTWRTLRQQYATR